jgi:hypothetical protein
VLWEEEQEEEEAEEVVLEEEEEDLRLHQAHPQLPLVLLKRGSKCSDDTLEIYYKNKNKNNLKCCMYALVFKCLFL